MSDDLDRAILDTTLALVARFGVDDQPLDRRTIRALAGENTYGPWVEDDGTGGRRDAIRWRYRLAAQSSRSADRRRRWATTDSHTV